MLLVPPNLGLAGFATAKDNPLILYVSPSGDTAHDSPPHSPTPLPVLTVSGAAGAKAIS